MKFSSTIFFLAFAGLAIAHPLSSEESHTIEPRRQGICCSVGYGAQNACRFFPGKTTCSVYAECPDSVCQ